jgi:hypothetical protein
MPGQIRVGRTIYAPNGKRTDPSYPGFTPIVVLTVSSPYGDLGPYVLKDEKGRIMENLYQASKIYETVPRTVCRYSRYDRTVIWDHPAETHMNEDGETTEEYWAWREKLQNNPYAVRYPVGMAHRKNCVAAFAEDEDGEVDPTPLDYVQARKRIYLELYVSMAKKAPRFKKLQQRLAKGENLLIIEVDGPHQESIDYYIENYGVSRDFIKGGTMLMTEENNVIMLNDTLHPYGHGYCLALALLGKEWAWL